MDEAERGRPSADAVPEPVAPPDRTARIARRVRGRRRAVVAGAAVAVVAVVAAGVGIAALVGPAAPPPAPAIALGSDGCPPVSASAPAGQPDRSGRLVPDDPVGVVMCEKPAHELPPWESRPIAQRHLNRGAAQFAALLNRGRTAEEQLAADRRRAVREGGDPSKVGLGCASMGYSTVISFVLHYADDSAVPVLADQSCGTLYAGGRTRYYDGGASGPVEAFLRSYRDDLAANTDPATIPTPPCAPTISPQRLNRQQLPSGPVDGVAPNRRWRGDGLLPSAVVAVAVCRYTVAPGGAHLITEHRSRTPGDLQQIVNRQAAITSPAPGDCGRNGPAPTILDVVTAADATQATLEVWLYRVPCTAFIAVGNDGMTAEPRLLAYVDGLLGPPR